MSLRHWVSGTRVFLDVSQPRLKGRSRQAAFWEVTYAEEVHFMPFPIPSLWNLGFSGGQPGLLPLWPAAEQQAQSRRTVIMFRVTVTVLCPHVIHPDPEICFLTLSLPFCTVCYLQANSVSLNHLQTKSPCFCPRTSLLTPRFPGSYSSPVPPMG